MTPLEFCALLAAGLAGGAAQSVLGFGAAIVTVPALAVIAPELLPTASLFAMLPLTSTMALRGRHDADLRAVGRMLLGRLPGVAVGSALVVAADTRTLTFFVAAVLLAAVASMARGWSIAITPTTQAAAGFVSGITGTSTGLGGPPLALLYRSVAGAKMRATLAVLFVGGILLSLGTLGVLGEVHLRHARIGLPMGAAAASGVLLAGGLAARVPASRLRQGVLVWASTGALVAVARAALA